MEPFDQYEIVPLGYGGNAFVFRHKGGAELLVTQRVSLDTLIRLALEDGVSLGENDA